MKHIISIQFILLTLVAASQDKFSGFNAMKKSMSLRTGIQMKYIDTGNPAGEPVILLHGYTDASRSFQLMIDELSAINKNIRIIAPDLRGHGESSIPDADKCKNAPAECFTMTLFAEDVIDLMNQLKIHQANIVGHSMGSVLAQTIVLSYPERVKKMILIGTFVNGKDNSAIHDFLINDMIEKNWRTILEKRPGFSWPADAYLLTPLDLGTETGTFLRENWIAEICADDKFIDAIYPETMRTPLGTWIGVIKSLGDMDNRKAFISLKTPTLILWGTQDPLLTNKEQDEVKAAFRTASQANGTKIIFKTYGKVPLPAQGTAFTDIGHNIQWGAPKEVAADVNSFIMSGRPVDNAPYANPKSVKEILVGKSDGNIITL